MATFKSSRAAVIELAGQYKDIVTELAKDHTLKEAKTQEEFEKAEELLFIEMCEICLWGNATDLSLLTNITIDDIKRLQGSEARKKAENNILVNDLSKAFAILNKAKKDGKKERRVDFVLDNAGFELYVDLILAGYLLATGLATTVVLRPKSIPWFVSDVVPKDFIQLIQVLANPQPFYSAQSDDEKEKPQPLSDKEVEELQFLFSQWSTHHAEGELIIRPDRFWTEGGSYWRLAAPQNKDLLDDLKESELVIFKGDLNYRKLTADVSERLRVTREHHLTPNRACGILPHLSPKPLVHWPTRASTSSHYERARPMSSLACLKARTKRSGLPKAVVVTLARGSGPGPANGL